MEIETNSDNPSNQLSNSLNKRNKLLLVIPISILVVLISIVGVISLSNQRKSTDNKSSQTENTSNINLPSKNIVVYTRCYGGERQPKHCNLYVSSLKEPEEKLIYSFDFPDVEQTDYETGFELTVNGIINKKVVYTKSYWEKKESERTEYNILGVIDLASAQDNIIYKQVRYPSKSGARDERDNDYISGIYLDGPNNKVYYSTETGPETGGKITQYGLSSNQNKVITDNTKLDYTSKVEYASSDKLYLSYSDDHIAGNYYISKILNLNSGTVTSTPKSWHNAVINKQGTKVAYIDEIPVGSNNTYNLSLNVSDLEGNNVKEIYSAPNTRLPADGYDGSYPYTVVSNYYFNEYGDRLSYSIRTPELVNGEYVGEKTTKYISILEVRRQNTQLSNQILTISGLNSELFRALLKAIWKKESTTEQMTVGTFDQLDTVLRLTSLTYLAE
ncbi:MAG: hypothetical protein HYW33_02530 [Candidatus Blackburnbacteria bacterium]|nr:hypothetical protein [Candidatus Blackburnbacteria bacterium]